jgi:signal transduction histidine kinase
VLVVGATRENRAEALRSLRTELLIAGPVALVLAIGLGYLLAGTGLQAVDAMRRRAAEISAQTPGERLPVPQTQDELQHLGETLNAMLGRLERALEREREFVAEAGHELRTPLALLRAELDYALHYAESEDELRGAVRRAGEETDRLVQLASDLLLVAVADAGRLALRLEPVATRDLLESVRTRFAWRAEADRRGLEVEAPEDLMVVVDRLRLEQALGNLVENALRYGAGTVTLTAGAAGAAVEFHVRDEGPGFPAEFLPRAFHRFSRAEGTRGRQGTGLGMPIVATIVEAHHGTTTASNGARGADVTIRIPVRRPALTRGPAVSTSPRP